MTAEERKNTPPDLGDENTVFMEGNEKAQEIKKAVGNKPFDEIQNDILSGVAQKDWISTVWNTLQAKFPGAIRIGNSNILIDKQSRDELTRSKSTGYLARNNQQMFEDKLRSMYNADELLKATTDWINEKVNHARKDKIVDFARGHVLFRVGSNDYVGEVVVGNRANGEMILYDIVRIQPTTITAKEVDVRDARNPLPENSRLQTSASSVDSILETSEKSNPQNGGRASAEVADRRALEREYQERMDAYQAASNRNDTEFDYRGEAERINELGKRLKEMEEDTSSAADAAPSPQGEGRRESSPQEEGTELERAEKELLEVGEATVRNDTGAFPVLTSPGRYAKMDQRPGLPRPAAAKERSSWI